MKQEVFIAFIGVVGGLIGGFIGGAINIWVERRRYRMELARLLPSFTSTSEVEKVRVKVYTDLWSRLGQISTFRLDEIVENLPKVKEELQDWYYHRGGGLVITGSFDQKESTKAAFFTARDLASSDPSEIWEIIHNLRICLRRDLKIFEDEKEEIEIIKKMKKTIEAIGH